MLNLIDNFALNSLEFFLNRFMLRLKLPWLVIIANFDADGILIFEHCRRPLHIWGSNMWRHGAGKLLDAFVLVDVPSDSLF